MISGPDANVAALRVQLEAEDIICQPLHTSHAFHSAMVDPIVEPLRAEVAKVKLRGPSRPLVSTVTGCLITAEETTNPSYWANQARATVQFSKAARTLKDMGYDLFLECGPRATMCSLTRQHFTPDRPCVAIPTLADTHEDNAEWASMLFALGSLWLNGVSIDWEGFYVHEDRRRIPLPNYPFERQRYWVEPAQVAAVAAIPPKSEAVPVVVAVEQANAESRKDRIAAMLLDILAPVSGRARAEISTSATFLEQGFDSLSLTQVAFAIRQEFGVKVSFSQLMNQLPNLKMVAEHLDHAVPVEQFGEAENRQAARKSTPEGVVSVASTAPQRGIFFSSRLSDHLSVSYNESMTLRITGTISVPKLTRSLERLVERHDSLRASFDENGAVMRMAPEMKLEVTVTDLSGARSEPEREDCLTKLTAEETARPFALPGGPLFRGQMVVLGADRAAVIFTGHHVICDGWSLDVLIHDLCAFYAEEISGAPAGLGPATSFASYASEVARREHSAEFAEAEGYWEKKFAEGFPVLVLPADFPRGMRREYRARRLDHHIGAPLVDKLRKLGTEQGCSFFAVILSALSILLARVSRQRRFVLALPMAEQPVVGKPELVGHCVSLMPFVVELRGKESVSSYLARVQAELGRAQDQSSFTLVNLLENLHSASPAPGVSPISAGLTSVRKFRPHELPQRGFRVEYDANPKSYESFEWYLNAIEAAEGLDLHCHYDIGLLKDATVKSWLAALEAILVDMVANPSRETVALAGLRLASTRPTAYVMFAYSPRSLQARVCRDTVAESVLSQVPAEEQEAFVLAALLKLWQGVLNLRRVGVDDDFFDLGGHSLLAAQLFASIERELGITAPLAALYEAPTPRKLARVLANGNSQKQWQSLVPINRAGSRTPLFLIHGAEGNVLLYRALASHLGGDQPVYGLQSAGLDGKSPIDSNFERVARRYVEEVRRVQAEGPYMLGGYCLGATIALEMARQLMEAGESVGLVAMIEHFNVRTIQWPLPWHLRAMNGIVLNPYYHLRNLFAAEGSGKVDFFLEKLRVEIRRAKVTSRVAWARARRGWKPGDAEEYHHIKVADVWDKALAGFDVKPYPGEITIFMSARRLAGMRDRLGGWGDVACGGVRLYTLPFSPKGSLTEPYVGHLAELLRECMDRAMEDSKASSEERKAELVVA